MGTNSVVVVNVVPEMGIEPRSKSIVTKPAILKVASEGLPLRYRYRLLSSPVGK